MLSQILRLATMENMMDEIGMNYKPLISIITVSKNAEKTIAETIESVLLQNYENVQYIIWDGKSSDKTFEIAKSYKDAFIRKGYEYYTICENDNGIYDAMNKSVQIAKGDWVYFLNANDKLVDSNVLDEVFDDDNSSFDCIYGDTWNVYAGVVYHKKSYEIDSIYYRAPFIHQALFAKTSVIMKYKFDCNYNIAADYDLFVRMYTDGIKFKKIDRDIAFFDMSGVSQHSYKERKEQWKAIRNNNGLKNKRKIQRIFMAMLELIKQNKIIVNIYYYYRQLRS